MNKKKKEPSITLLENSVYYFLNSVFISHLDDGFRLIVIHNNRLKTDNTYKTMSEAKLAFDKYYRQKAWREDVRPLWSHRYYTDEKWLAEQLNKGTVDIASTNAK